MRHPFAVFGTRFSRVPVAVPRMGALIGAMACAVTCLAACGSSKTVAATPRSPATASADGAVMLTPESAKLGLRRSMVADEYFWLRAKLLERDAPESFTEAVEAIQDIRSDFMTDPVAWEDLEVPLGSVAKASDLASVYSDLAPAKDVGGHIVPLRSRAMRLARALQTTEATFRDGPYRDHEGAITQAARDLTARLSPNEDRIFEAIQRDMGVAVIDRPIVVTLVNDAPYPGIFAADQRGRAMASFVRVRGLGGTDLVETVLHESLHAIDEITVRSSTSMNALRAAFAKRGIDAEDATVEMAVNTVTFAEAASLVRRFVDPKHKPTAEGGFYTLYPPAPAIVAAWERHVAGEPIETTVDAIAQAATSSP